MIQEAVGAENVYLDIIAQDYILIPTLKKINDQIRSRITGTTAHIYPDDIGKNVFIPRLSSKANEKEIGDRLRKSLRMFRDFEVVYADYEEFLNNSIKEFDE